MFCLHCGHENGKNANFCTNCGGNVSENKSSTSGTQQPLSFKEYVKMAVGGRGSSSAENVPHSDTAFKNIKKGRKMNVCNKLIRKTRKMKS